MLYLSQKSRFSETKKEKKLLTRESYAHFMHISRNEAFIADKRKIFYSLVFDLTFVFIFKLKYDKMNV